MRIELKCCCGATATFDDTRGVYIRPGGEPDANGRRYQIEVRADEWQESHKPCHLARARNELIERAAPGVIASDGGKNNG